MFGNNYEKSDGSRVTVSVNRRLWRCFSRSLLSLRLLLCKLDKRSGSAVLGCHVWSTANIPQLFWTFPQTTDMAANEMVYRKHYIPLESNPMVFTQLIHKLGVSTTLAFHDVLSIDDPDLLASSHVPHLPLFLSFLLQPLMSNTRPRKRYREMTISAAGKMSA